MGLLKSFAQIKQAEPAAEEIKPNFETERQTYHQDGAKTSLLCHGRPENLKASLDAIYHKFENKCREEATEQANLKQPYTNELKGKKTLLITKSEELAREREKLDQVEKEIESLRNKIVDVKRDPQKYGIPADR